jgi:hypothetical protein
MANGLSANLRGAEQQRSLVGFPIVRARDSVYGRVAGYARVSMWGEFTLPKRRRSLRRRTQTVVAAGAMRRTTKIAFRFGRRTR